MPQIASAPAAPSLERLWELCWHPVCTLAELEARDPHPLAVTLLDRELAVVMLDGGPVAFTDRCPHRSTRLSVGWVESGTLRCAYHGWRYAPDGTCVDIPAMPAGPIPATACAESFATEVAYDLVWVRLDPQGGTTIPAHPGFVDGSMHVIEGPPYTWGVGAARRVENFTDLSHFAWVHDGTLGRRDDPVPQLPVVRRESGELRFEYDPPDMDTDPTALFGMSRYRMPMPLTVDIEFELRSGAHRRLWMTASPVRDGVCRTFWSVSRDDDLDDDVDGGLHRKDEAHLDFQRLVLVQDEPVVTNQVPPELSLEVGFEVSVRPDRVSIEYRRWLRELALAAVTDPAAVGEMLQRATWAAAPTAATATVEAGTG